MELSPHCLTAVIELSGIQSWIGFGTSVKALVHSVLYPRKLDTTLALKLFRRERAITRFD